MTDSPSVTVKEAYRLAADTFGEAETEAVLEVLRSRQLTMADRVSQFETEFAAWVGAKHAVMVNSGSSANLVLVDTLIRGTADSARLQPGDEVLVPGLSWPTTVWPVAQLGLVPVFVDVDPATLAIDLESAERVLSDRTRAMFLIHPLGRAVDLGEYEAFCGEHGLVFIEDCCESLGAHWNGQHVGTVGDGGTFSFYFSHHISTIEGGMVVTNDPSRADDLRSLRAHGWIRDRSDRDRWIGDYPHLDSRFLFATLGYNVRPTEIQAAIGSVQLRRLDQMIEARMKLAGNVRDWLKRDAPWLELIGSDSLDAGPSMIRTERCHTWMTLPLRVVDGAPFDRQTVMDKLERSGVETRPVIAGNLVRHPALRDVKHRVATDMRVCDGLLNDSFMIGCHPIVSAASMATLEEAISKLGHADL